jgi:hypothetical protein
LRDCQRTAKARAKEDAAWIRVLSAGNYLQWFLGDVDSSRGKGGKQRDVSHFPTAPRLRSIGIERSILLQLDLRSSRFSEGMAERKTKAKAKEEADSQRE